MTGDKGCLEQDVAQGAPPAADGAFAAAGTAVAGDGCKSREGGRLFA